MASSVLLNGSSYLYEVSYTPEQVGEYVLYAEQFGLKGPSTPPLPPLPSAILPSLPVLCSNLPRCLER